MLEKSLMHSIIDKVIFLSIIAIFFVPFTIPYSYYPEGKFYSELVAFILAMFIPLLVVFKVKKVGVSAATIACFAFGLYLLFQMLVVHIRIPGINVYVALQMFIAGCLSIGITSLVTCEKSHQDLCTQIAWAAVISVTLQAFYGILQYTGIAKNYTSFVLYAGSTSSDIIGNIGQKNDYVDFIFMGVFASSYLYFIKQIKPIYFICYVLFLGFVITIDTSRTAFVFLIVAFIIALIFKKNSNIKSNQILKLIVILFIGLIAMEAIVPKLLSLFGSQHDLTSGLYRLGSGSIHQSTYRRFYEWYKDIVLFSMHPIFGIGWYQYPKAAIDIMNTARFMYIPCNSALYTHSHNTPLNILAETGIVGFFISMVYGVGYSVYRMFKNFNNYNTLFLILIASAIFTQGLLQYPLWYVYFLMFFVLILSVDKPLVTIKNNIIIKVSSLIIFAVFIYFVNLNIGYYNQLTILSQVPQDSDDYITNVNTLVDIADNNLIWSFPALIVLDNYIMPTSNTTAMALTLDQQKDYIDKIANELPYPGAIYKQIIIYKALGNDGASLYYATLLAHAYPFFKDQFANQLRHFPQFAPEVQVIDGFHYEDRSIFAKYFHLKDN